MVEISAKIVKELRDKTSAGMMDCKKALQEFDGDLEKAMESLKKKGLASADKKSSRIASEGLIEAYILQKNESNSTQIKYLEIAPDYFQEKPEISLEQTEFETIKKLKTNIFSSRAYPKLSN